MIKRTQIGVMSIVVSLFFYATAANSKSIDLVLEPSLFASFSGYETSCYYLLNKGKNTFNGDTCTIDVGETNQPVYIVNLTAEKQNKLIELEVFLLNGNVEKVGFDSLVLGKLTSDKFFEQRDISDVYDFEHKYSTLIPDKYRDWKSKYDSDPHQFFDVIKRDNGWEYYMENIFPARKALMTYLNVQ